MDPARRHGVFALERGAKLGFDPTAGVVHGAEDPMAKLKKTARASAGPRRRASAKTRPAQAEGLGKSITESAQQIWLAGIGAFNRAQAEGGKLFESLVRDGLSLERSARTRAEVVRDAVEDTVGHARERAGETWDRLEKVFEDRVQRTLVKLGVPARADLDALGARVERLTAELRKANARGTPASQAVSASRKAAPARVAARKAPPRRATKAKHAAPPPA